jgi:putative peptidoglycan lipid II flippase
VVQLSKRLRRVWNPAFFNSLIVMGGYLLSRLTGLLRDIVISAQFGTSAQLDAYRAAFKVTDFLYLVIIGGALGSSFIPVFVQAWNRDGAERAWKVASAVTTWALIILGAVSALLFVIAEPLTAWLWGSGFDAEGLALISQLTRLFLLSPLFLGLGGLAMAVLNARDRFTLPALAPVIYNVGIMVGAIVLAPSMGVWGLAWGVIGGAALYLLIQIPGLVRLGMRLAPTFGSGLIELRTIAVHMLPRIIGQSAAQASILVTALLTTKLALGHGQISGLDYAYQIMMLPFGIFSLSLSTVAFPRLAALFADGEIDTLMANVRRTLGLILFLSIPSALALTILGVPVVRLLFQRASFDESSLLLTVGPLLGYATALPAFAASEILIRTFYAMQRTLAPVLIGLAQIAINLGLGLLIVQTGGTTTQLAFAFSIANNLEALLLALVLLRYLPGIWRSGSLWRSLGATCIGSVLMGLALVAMRQFSLEWLPFLEAGQAYQWRSDLVGLALWLIAAGLIGGLVYLGSTLLAGSPDVRTVADRLLRRKQAPQEE